MSFLSNIEWRRAEKTFSPCADDSLDNSISQVQYAMIQAPSSFGVQPYHIIAVRDDAIKMRLLQVSYNQPQVIECHTLFILCARNDISQRVEECIQAGSIGSPYSDMMRNMLSTRSVEWATHQAYIALGYGLAACTELKVASCPMEGFDSSKVKEVLNLPQNLHPCVYLAVGKKSIIPSSTPRFRFSEQDMVTKI